MKSIAQIVSYQKKKNNQKPTKHPQATYNRRMETTFIFAVTENEIFPYNMIYALRFTKR